MKNFFTNKFNIKSVILIIAISIVVSILLTGSLSFYFLKRTQTFITFIHEVEELNKNINELVSYQQNYILNDINSSAYYQTGESQNFINFTEKMAEVSVKIENLKNDNPVNNAFITEKLEELSTNLLQYDKTFKDIIEIYIQKGNKNSGLYQEVNLKSQALQQAVQNTALASEISYMQNIQAAEQDLLTNCNLNTEQQHTNVLNELINALKQDISTQIDTTQTIVVQNDTDISKQINEYKNSVQNYVEICHLLGNEDKSGKQIEINTLANKILALFSEFSLYIAQHDKKFITYGLIVLLTLVVLFSVTLVLGVLQLGKNIVPPLIQFREYITKLGIGELPPTFEIKGQSELREIAGALNNLTDNLKRTKEFVNEVGKGNLESQISVFNNQGELGRSLLEMREELQKIAKERETQEIEDRKRNWGAQGVARFSEILRNFSDNQEELSFHVLKELVEYLEAVQGMLYIINDSEPENKFLELMAVYAYSRRKFMEKRIELGEGIAGQCALEKQTVYLVELPQGHFEISTALGLSEPKSVLIVPLQLNNDIFGVVEIASFKTMEAYQIEFAEKIAETVASSISNAKITSQTSKLLEESKRQAEELASKEEEMRQNMEELQATQEEAARKEAIASGFVNSVNHSIIRADFSLTGHLDYANSKFTDLVGLKTKELKGMHYSEFINYKDVKDFDKQWERIVKGGRHIEEEMRHKTNDTYRWLLATYTPIRSPHGEVTKILYLAIDIHNQKAKNLDYKRELSAINSAIIKAEYDANGKVISVNKHFQGLLGYNANDIQDKTALSFIHPIQLDEFKISWLKITQGVPFEGRTRMATNKGEERWLQGTYTPVRDAENEIYKIVHISYDITNQMLMQKESLEQSKALVEQQQILERNIQAMTAVQNEMAKKDAAMRAQLNAINKTNALAEYTIDGDLIYANNIFCELFGYIENDIINRNHRMFIMNNQRNSLEYKQMWNTLREGESVEGEFERMDRGGNIIYIKGIYTPIFDMNGKPEKVLELAFDISQSKKQQAEITGQIEAISKTNGIVEYRLDGTIINANDIVCKLFGFKQEELIGKHHRILVGDTVALSTAYQQFWTNIIHGHFQEGEFQRTGKRGNTFYLKEIHYPILDIAGKPYKVLMLCFDITQQKLQQQSLEEQVRINENQRKQLSESLDVLKINEEKLRKAFDLAKQRELEIQSKNDELASSEEELRQNLEELQTTQEAMELKQIELEKLNEKITSNEKNLQKAFNEAKEKELLLEKMNKNLEQNEQELRLNIEKLHTAQEEMAKSKMELEKAFGELQTKEQNLVEALRKAKEDEDIIRIMNDDMRSSEEELRQNMEELEATQEAMEQKQKELERSNKKMAANEMVLKKAVEKSIAKEAELKTKLDELEEYRQHMSNMQEQIDFKNNELQISFDKMKANEAILKSALLRFKEKQKSMEDEIISKEQEIKQLKEQLNNRNS